MAGDVDAVEVDGLTRRFGETTAVDGISFRVAAGEVFGFLGPNGAGKSTTVKIVCTLLRPSSGTARVAGHDVIRAPTAVRRALGLLFQDPSLDDRLTARENLRLHAVIYGVPHRARAARIDEALAWVDLAPQADHLVRTFSGGMRRRWSWRARSCTALESSSSTSRPSASTPRRGGRSGSGCSRSGAARRKRPGGWCGATSCASHATATRCWGACRAPSSGSC
jgi:ABC-type transporter Mla maintaining outer membrane lipid asymmetry ATPase subunit MlaF